MGTRALPFTESGVDSLSKVNGSCAVVVLIDEYDAPVSQALDDLGKAEVIRSRMGTFFSMMKTRTGAIRFLMMTGVSKFTKMSVFSCLNNIVDISMDEEYAGDASLVGSHPCRFYDATRNVLREMT